MSELEPRVLSLVPSCVLERQGENLGWRTGRENTQTFAQNPSAAELSVQCRGGTEG